MKKFIILAIIVTVVLWFLMIQNVGAAAVEKITWCHTEPNGNQQTLELPQAALEQAGHVDANGNPLHAGDHAGECVEVTPSVTPSVTPEVTVSITPEVTATPSATPSDTPSTSNGGSTDDGLGCGHHDCSEHKTVSVPSTPPATGRAS